MKTQLHPAVSFVLSSYINEDITPFLSTKKTFSMSYASYINDAIEEHVGLIEETFLKEEDKSVLMEAVCNTYNYFLKKEVNTIGWKQYYNTLISSLNAIVERLELSATLLGSNTDSSYMDLYDKLYEALESRETLNIAMLKKIEKAIVAKHGKDLDDIQLDIVKAFFNKYYLTIKRELLSRKYYFLHREDVLRLYKETRDSFIVS